MRSASTRERLDEPVSLAEAIDDLARDLPLPPSADRGRPTTRKDPAMAQTPDPPQIPQQRGADDGKQPTTGR
jgi:hypothetical protein